MLITRLLYADIKAHLVEKEYSIITGARQVGKTTLVRQLYNELTKKYQYVFYITLENYELLNELNKNPENIFNFIHKPLGILNKKLNEQDRVYLIIDEIQYAKDPSHLLKYFYDTYEFNLKIIATGSSAFYIDTKFKDSLAGRKKIFYLSTLDFEEFLLFKQEIGLQNELRKIRKSINYKSLFYKEIVLLLEKYIIYGGYPAVTLDKDVNSKQERLQELKNSYLKKDILESQVGNEMVFYQMTKLLAEQSGNILNRNEIAGTLKVNSKTIDHYIYILQKCFHINLLPPFFLNLRKELTKMPKVYFNDPGMRNAMINNFYPLNNRNDKGALIENYVYTRLKQLYAEEQLRYWRTTDGNEVDFIIPEQNGKGLALEVKYQWTKDKRSKYKKFMEAYPNFIFQQVSFDFDEMNSIPIIRL